MAEASLRSDLRIECVVNVATQNIGRQYKRHYRLQEDLGVLHVLRQPRRNGCNNSRDALGWWGVGETRRVNKGIKRVGGGCCAMGTCRWALREARFLDVALAKPPSAYVRRKYEGMSGERYTAIHTIKQSNPTCPKVSCWSVRRVVNVDATRSRSLVGLAFEQSRAKEGRRTKVIWDKEWCEERSREEEMASKAKGVERVLHK
ncbi:hypothetical protein BDN72DRAFT_865133 [Pluteus cervinus]|uniref:Uncharacterized protein n=1 Tax=Pluteus cervinus TaxID=181527 RepID=A0ACD3A185_9AGAR|nr:hypothetical protein BDN72DRAFT_865133 [Pluteus cervinus]